MWWSARPSPLRSTATRCAWSTIKASCSTCPMPPRNIIPFPCSPASPPPIRCRFAPHALPCICNLSTRSTRRADAFPPTLSQVDLSDPEDVRAMFLGAVRQPLVHFGDSDYLARYLAYQAHLREWLQQYPGLRSVDMRYGKQVVLDTGSVADGSTAPLDDSSDAKAFAPVHDATTAPHSSETSKPSANSEKHATTSTHSSSTHQKTTTHTHDSRHTPERGHPVKHPIMHVVSGM